MSLHMDTLKSSGTTDLSRHSVSNERQSDVTMMKAAACSFASSSGCLLLCLGLSVLTMLLQNLWMPLDISPDEPTGRSPEEQGSTHAVSHQRPVGLKLYFIILQRIY